MDAAEKDETDALRPSAERGHFDGRVALVTGAAQGMGAATAKMLAAGGAQMVLFDLQTEPLHLLAEQMEAECGRRVVAHAGDVTKSADVDALIAQALATFGRIDILVNAAGALRPTGIFEMSEDEWDWLVGVNLKGSFLTSRAVAVPMRARGYGRVIHFSSTAGKTVSTLGGCHYTAAKHGVLGLTRALAKELAPLGITVNAVCPGLIDTEMVRNTVTREQIEQYEAAFPIPRLGTADEVAALVCFLASDQAGYITGAAVDITGGDFLG